MINLSVLEGIHSSSGNSCEFTGNYINPFNNNNSNNLKPMKIEKIDSRTNFMRAPS